MNFQFYQPFTGVVRHLIILNVLVFIGSYAILGSETWSVTDREYTKLGRLYLAVYMPGSEHFRPFQLVTHMFMHGDLMHLAFNMLSLYIFGPMVEAVWGHRRFLFYYLFCGLGSYALHLGVQWWELEQMGIDPTSYNGAMPAWGPRLQPAELLVVSAYVAAIRGKNLPGKPVEPNAAAIPPW